MVGVGRLECFKTAPEEQILATSSNDIDRLTINLLQNEIRQVNADIATAEAELEEKQAEIDFLERKIRLRLGRFIDSLARIELDIVEFRDELARRQSPLDTDSGYLPVEEQYRRIWATPTTETSTPDQSEEAGAFFDLSDEKLVKRLYRQLARRYHPDLARDTNEMTYRTRKMAALNEAYASRNLTELAALASETDLRSKASDEGSETATDLLTAFENELTQLKQHLSKIRNEIVNLSNSPVVQLSLESKLAKQTGRDLLGEMVVNLRQTIRMKERERDRLKSRLNQLLDQ